MLREALLAVLGAVIAFVVVCVGFPILVFVVLFVQRKGWSVKLKNLIGGVFVAVIVAVVIAKVPSVYIECSYWPYCWPF